MKLVQGNNFNEPSISSPSKVNDPPLLLEVGADHRILMNRKKFLSERVVDEVEFMVSSDKFP